MTGEDWNFISVLAAQMRDTINEDSLILVDIAEDKVVRTILERMTKYGLPNGIYISWGDKE